jgi:hypothetical protein
MSVAMSTSIGVQSQCFLGRSLVARWSRGTVLTRQDVPHGSIADYILSMCHGTGHAIVSPGAICSGQPSNHGNQILFDHGALDLVMEDSVFCHQILVE